MCMWLIVMTFFGMCVVQPFKTTRLNNVTVSGMVLCCISDGFACMAGAGSGQ